MQSHIPEKCHTCPAYIIGTEKINDLNQMIDKVTSLAFSDDLDSASRTVRDALAEMEGFSPDDLPADELAHELRKGCGSAVEKLNEKITTLQQGMAKLALNCFGPAVLSGEANRRSYKVTVCASGSKPTEEVELAVVKSTRI